MDHRGRTTILNVLQTVFPNGTQAIDPRLIEELLSEGEALPQITSSDVAQTTDQPSEFDSPWRLTPVLPYDVFAFCAYMIQQMGLMGYFEPDPTASPRFGKPATGRPSPLMVVINEAERKRCVEASLQWRKTSSPPQLLHSLWALVFSRRRQQIKMGSVQKWHRDTVGQEGQPAEREAPPWWKALFQMLIIADEACDRIGHVYSTDDASGANQFQRWASIRVKRSRLTETVVSGGAVPNMVRANRHVATFAGAADSSVVCVQPKGRVTQVGCTLRSISRNLAITGPEGTVRCSWQQVQGEPKADAGESLDILLVPLPYHLRALDFAKVRENQGDGARWGNFGVSQTWLDGGSDEICEIVRSLIGTALNDVGSINAVVFPEYALSFDLFRKLMDVVYDATEGTVEFMIAGSSGNCDGDETNCVLTAIWEKSMTAATGSDRPRARLVSQRKHH
ncbi:hypothetical protein [Jannaschia aquimarina]|uniref:Uncharacterized protein n=1 Tax=Jannaschia aquimarina TaxID=935700 RepID=A0A0D1CL79_9RHOB|nr:hypothetical protein [Jannaschia aquimarina]KIT15562.1 hypothetical protein jaqu_26590 [Jannaschia aquimarina]SNT26992.1 hypothetical protein SAMN05421775_109114 [Jannaschia aquimarina]